MENRDLFKEAIADAKTIKETALANAKATLEESFAPFLREKNVDIVTAKKTRVPSPMIKIIFRKEKYCLNNRIIVAYTSLSF